MFSKPDPWYTSLVVGVVLAAALTPFVGEKALTYCGLGLRLYTRNVPELAKYAVLRRLMHRAEIGHFEMYAGLDEEEECMAYARLPYIAALDEWMVDPGEHNMLYTAFFEIEYPTQRMVFERYAGELAGELGVPVESVNAMARELSEYCCDEALTGLYRSGKASDSLIKAIERVTLRHARVLSVKLCEIIIGQEPYCRTYSVDEINKIASHNQVIRDLPRVLGLG